MLFHLSRLWFESIAIKVHAVKYITAILKEKTMKCTTTAELAQQDYDSRASEIRYAESLTATEIPVPAPKIGAAVLSGLTVASEALRPLFSWNPQRQSSNDEES
jgi:hypothetical protein